MCGFWFLFVYGVKKGWEARVEIHKPYDLTSIGHRNIHAYREFPVNSPFSACLRPHHLYSSSLSLVRFTVVYYVTFF